MVKAQRTAARRTKRHPARVEAAGNLSVNAFTAGSRPGTRRTPRRPRVLKEMASSGTRRRTSGLDTARLVSEYSLTMQATAAPRQTADERRVEVLNAATHEFAVRGLHGASTENIARAAGISQPYLFRLFGSKKGLYLAAAERCADELFEVFARAAEGHSGEAALQAMGEAYSQVMQDRDRLMLMLSTWTSCDDPDIHAPPGAAGRTWSISPSRPRAKPRRWSAGSSPAAC